VQCFFLSFMLISLAFMSFFSTAVFAADMEAYRQQGVCVTVSSSWNPFSFVGYDGKPSGILVDLWRLWSRKTDIPVRFKSATWAETLKLMAEGKCDIHSGLYYTNERDEFLDYSKPFYESQGALVSLKDSSISCEELYEKALIGVMASGYEEYFLRTKRPETRYREYPNTPAILRALLDGEVQGSLFEYASLLMEAREMGLTNRINLCGMQFKRALHAAVAQGDSELLEVVQYGLSLISDEEFAYIKRVWLVGDYEPEREWDNYILVLFGVCLSIFLFRKLLNILYGRTVK